MADVFSTLLQSAIYKRAAVMEQWLVNHKEHYPGPYIEYSNDIAKQTGRCSCGESFSADILINIMTDSKGKDR